MAVTVVQSVGSSLTAGSPTLTLASAVTAGNTIIAAVTGYDSATAITWTVTDNKNGATNYTQAAYVSAVITGTERENAGVYYLDNTAGSTGTNSFTATFHFTHGSSNSAACLLEVSGLDSSGSLDQHNTNQSTGTTDSASVTAPGANAAANEIIVGAMALYAAGNPMNIAASGGYTDKGLEQNGGSFNPSGCAYKVASAGETSTVAWTHLHTGQLGWVAAMASFKPPGAGADVLLGQAIL